MDAIRPGSASGQRRFGTKGRGEGCAIGIRHLMGAYCHFHYPNHEAQLRRWGFDLDHWLAEFRKLLQTIYLLPAERAGWHALFKEMRITEYSVPPSTRQTDQPLAARPGGWDIFIAHASPDKATAEQLFDRLEADGHRVFLDARSSQATSGIWRSHARSRRRG